MRNLRKISRQISVLLRLFNQRWLDNPDFPTVDEVQAAIQNLEENLTAADVSAIESGRIRLEWDADDREVEVYFFIGTL